MDRREAGPSQIIFDNRLRKVKENGDAGEKDGRWIKDR